MPAAAYEQRTEPACYPRLAPHTSSPAHHQGLLASSGTLLLMSAYYASINNPITWNQQQAFGLLDAYPREIFHEVQAGRLFKQRIEISRAPGARKLSGSPVAFSNAC